IKFYSRWKTPHTDDSKVYQREYTKERMRELDTPGEDTIKAHTNCSDRTALSDLLFAYYYLGDVRNSTNHAADEFSGFINIMNESDISERMILIKHSIDYFLYCYDNVLSIMEADKAEPNVIKVDTTDLSGYANELRKQYYDEKNNKE
ncbi:MAG: hypothetical protein K5644_10280, partial [Lachnospiraceae bacterium]|nr:hypothetical protein [Lachnospiraceae bacterium]